jgi:hypothetical protein
MWMLSASSWRIWLSGEMAEVEAGASMSAVAINLRSLREKRKPASARLKRGLMDRKTVRLVHPQVQRSMQQHAHRVAEVGQNLIDATIGASSSRVNSRRHA